MDRGAWHAIVQGIARVRHDLVLLFFFFFLRKELVLTRKAEAHFRILFHSILPKAVQSARHSNCLNSRGPVKTVVLNSACLCNLAEWGKSLRTGFLNLETIGPLRQRILC